MACLLLAKHPHFIIIPQYPSADTCHLSANPDRLEQVLINLLDNAIRVTPTYKIIEAHGGSINVFSKPGEGSTFVFIIPKG